MPEHDPLILSYSHLKAFPREKEAFHALKKVASLVKPIMRARGWRVRELAEFFPEQDNLLGLNVNKGQKILLRLRHASDRNQFIPVEQVTDTMLHELSHIVHGPHDAKFQALWNQLRDEHEALVRKGYTGEGFLSDGHRLGGRHTPLHEARRLARAAAEKRRVVSAGPGQKLGGAAPRPGTDMRGVFVSAIERRNRALRGCGNTNHNDNEIRQISETASRNGFRTKAEEDEANDAAIAQALWELIQEDEKERYGDSYIPASAQDPVGNGGGSVFPERGNSGPGPSSKRQRNNFAGPSTSSGPARPGLGMDVSTSTSVPATGWTCAICTLHNPPEFLCCDVCGNEKVPEKAQRPRPPKRPAPPVVDLTAGEPGFGAANDAATANRPAPVLTWQCSFCGMLMERQWWTCSMCGRMKDSSR